MLLLNILLLISGFINFDVLQHFFFFGTITGGERFPT